MRLPARLLFAILLPMLTTLPARAAPPALDGTAWTLAALPGRDLLPDRVATLRFEAGRVAGHDGCNPFTGAYAEADGGFRVEQVAQTQMACPAEPGRQAQAFMAALSAARATRLDGGRLQLRDAAGVVLATLAAQREDLAGTSWQVTGYHDGRQAVTSPLRGTALTLEFLADGRLAGSAGCNRFTTRYTQASRTLTIPPAAATRRLCAEPAGVMAQEAAFLAALPSAARLRVDGDRLELRTADDRIAIRALRRGTGPASSPSSSPPATPAGPRAPARASPPAPALGVRRTFAADLVYLADAAVVTVCSTLGRHPVAMEADWLAMERAYRARAKPPGSPLHVTFEGQLVERPKVDGAGTEPTMLVQRFIQAWPGETCERARVDASFANTYWKIARLGATDVGPAPGRREPHLRVRSAGPDGQQGEYSATVGCNTFRGRYRLAGGTLKFEAGAATRMACPPPLDALERQLGEALGRAARAQLTANTMELFDDAGRTQGAFQAVYF